DSRDGRGAHHELPRRTAARARAVSPGGPGRQRDRRRQRHDRVVPLWQVAPAPVLRRVAQGRALPRAQRRRIRSRRL
ncbi:MAG: zinc finger, CDGSH-type domain protein, partial [uncultured Solirubrobacteraceae bacterium]